MHFSRKTIQLVAVSCLLPVAVFAHEAASIETDIEGPKSRFRGSLELRPSYEAGAGNFFGENIVELGYQFSHKFQVAYSQEFHHNIARANPDPEHEGLGMHLETGLAKAHFHEVWESTDGKSSLSLEPRIHLPTAAEDRAKGFVTAGLVYAKFRRNLSPNLGLTVMEGPMFYVNSVRGGGDGEEFEANPTFQNRMQVALDVSLFNRKVSLTLPLLFYLTRHADFDPAAKHNDTWTPFLGLAPELGYNFAKGFNAGVAIVTPNLIDKELAEHSVNHGRTNTVGQLFLRAEL